MVDVVVVFIVVVVVVVVIVVVMTLLITLYLFAVNKCSFEVPGGYHESLCWWHWWGSMHSHFHVKPNFI